MNNKKLELFGAIVRRERQRRGLSQEAFAELCGLHRTYIGGIERGERNPGLLNLIKIAHTLGMPLSSLLQDMDRKPQQ